MMNTMNTAIAAVVLVLIILVICLRKVIKCNAFLMSLAIIIAGGTVALSAWALEEGSAYLTPAGDPVETVNNFFTCIVDGKYEEAYTYLENYSTLGLENEPTAEDSARLYEALQNSYSYELLGEMEVNGLNAKQEVSFTSLDLAELTSHLREGVNGMLEEAVENTAAKYVYDEDKNYLPEFVDALYDKALDDLLARSDEFMMTKTFTVELKHDGESWHLKADNAMFTAMCGNSVG